MDDGCVAILAFLVVVAIVIVVVVYVILPVSLLVLAGIAVTGTVSGAVVAAKNFKEVLVEAHKTIR